MLFSALSKFSSSGGPLVPGKGSMTIIGCKRMMKSNSGSESHWDPFNFLIFFLLLCLHDLRVQSALSTNTCCCRVDLFMKLLCWGASSGYIMLAFISYVKPSLHTENNLRKKGFLRQSIPRWFSMPVADKSICILQSVSYQLTHEIIFTPDV